MFRFQEKKCREMPGTGKENFIGVGVGVGIEGRVQGSGFQGSGFRVSGFRVQGSGKTLARGRKEVFSIQCSDWEAGGRRRRRRAAGEREKLKVIHG